MLPVKPVTATSLYALAVPSGALTPAERTVDSCNSYLAALQAMALRRDLPARRASQHKPAAHARSVPLTVTVEGERHGFGRLWFDGAGWHQRLVLGRRPLCWFDGSVWRPRRVPGRYLLRGPVELVVVAKLPPAMPDAGLADAAAAACCGLALADLTQVQRAVLCREAAIGCTRPGPEGSAVRPGEARRIPLRIVPDGLGAVRYRRCPHPPQRRPEPLDSRCWRLAVPSAGWLPPRSWAGTTAAAIHRPDAGARDSR
jgi:hypothetical protein